MFTLKKVRYMKALSHETHCYSAALHLNGSKVAEVSNAGHGGSDDIYYVNADTRAIVDDAIATLNPEPKTDLERANLIRKRIKWLEDVGDACYHSSMCTESDEKLISEHSELLTRSYMNANLEGICCELVNDWLEVKEMKRIMTKSVVYTKIGMKGLFQTNNAKSARQRDAWIPQVASWEGTETVLNSLTADKAFAIFKERT